jgi:hypothetical protein
MPQLTLLVAFTGKAEVSRSLRVHLFVAASFSRFVQETAPSIWALKAWPLLLLQQGGIRRKKGAKVLLMEKLCRPTANASQRFNAKCQG